MEKIVAVVSNYLFPAASMAKKPMYPAIVVGTIPKTFYKLLPNESFI